MWEVLLSLSLRTVLYISIPPGTRLDAYSSRKAVWSKELDNRDRRTNEHVVIMYYSCGCVSSHARKLTSGSTSIWAYYYALYLLWWQCSLDTSSSFVSSELIAEPVQRMNRRKYILLFFITEHSKANKKCFFPRFGISIGKFPLRGRCDRKTDSDVIKSD